MRFENLPDNAPRIATERVKWNLEYQEKHGIKTGMAKDLPDGVADRIAKLCKRVYRILGLSGYARMDFRLTDDGRIFLLEPNPNPDLAREKDKLAGLDAYRLRVSADRLRRVRRIDDRSLKHWSPPLGQRILWADTE